MGHTNWIILGFGPQKCTQFFSDRDSGISEPSFQAGINSAASAVSRDTKVHESKAARGQRLGMRTEGGCQAPLDSRILVFLQAALAADLITA